MKKILLLLGCIFLITGCKVEYNLVINNDLTVFEEVKMTGTDEFFDNYYMSTKINIVNMIFNEGKQNTLKENGYSYEIINENTPYVIAEKKYNDLSQYSKNTIFFQQYFDSVNVTENDGIVSLNTGEFIPNNPDSLERYDIKTSTIKIKSPFKVVENNASLYDEKTNTYTWYIENDTTDFSINLSYDSNEIYVPPKDNINIILIIVAIIFMVGSIVVYIVNKKNKSFGPRDLDSALRSH